MLKNDAKCSSVAPFPAAPQLLPSAASMHHSSLLSLGDAIASISFERRTPDGDTRTGIPTATARIQGTNRTAPPQHDAKLVSVSALMRPASGALAGASRSTCVATWRLLRRYTRTLKNSALNRIEHTVRLKPTMAASAKRGGRGVCRIAGEMWTYERRGERGEES